MKTYKHKRLGWIAKQSLKEMYDLHIGYGLDIKLPKELMEDSLDREEVIEKDWIDEAREYYFEGNTQTLEKYIVQDFREAIEKHMPKITEEDINKYVHPSKLANGAVGRDVLILKYNRLLGLIKEKGLYKE